MKSLLITIVYISFASVLKANDAKEIGGSILNFGSALVAGAGIGGNFGQLAGAGAGIAGGYMSGSSSNPVAQGFNKAAEVLGNFGPLGAILNGIKYQEMEKARQAAFQKTVDEMIRAANNRLRDPKSVAEVQQGTSVLSRSNQDVQKLASEAIRTLSKLQYDNAAILTKAQFDKINDYKAQVGIAQNQMKELMNKYDYRTAGAAVGVVSNLKMIKSIADQGVNDFSQRKNQIQAASSAVKSLMSTGKLDKISALAVKKEEDKLRKQFPKSSTYKLKELAMKKVFGDQGKNIQNALSSQIQARGATTQSQQTVRQAEQALSKLKELAKKTNAQPGSPLMKQINAAKESINKMMPVAKNIAAGKVFTKQGVEEAKKSSRVISESVKTIDKEAKKALEKVGGKAGGKTGGKAASSGGRKSK